MHRAAGASAPFPSTLLHGSSSGGHPRLTEGLPCVRPSQLAICICQPGSMEPRHAKLRAHPPRTHTYTQTRTVGAAQMSPLMACFLRVLSTWALYPSPRDGCLAVVLRAREAPDTRHTAAACARQHQNQPSSPSGHPLDPVSLLTFSTSLAPYAASWCRITSSLPSMASVTW